jgi:Flp pilus assembly protein TadD
VRPVPSGTSPASFAFITGRIVLDDGSPAPANVAIVRICSTTPQTVAWTDDKGYFGFQWGNSMAVMADASQSGARNTSGVLGSLAGVLGPTNNTGAGPGTPSGNAIPAGAVQNCELRASLPGYRSDTVSLANRKATDNPNVGMIVLHHAAQADSGASVSAAALAAPRSATDAYEQGMKSLKAGDSKAAAKAWNRAVALYPRFAEAWFELGFLAARGKNWADSAKYLDRGLAASPTGFPQAWYADAMAHYYLSDFDAAERAAREAVRLDSAHRNPRAGYVLGMTLAQKKDFAAAASELRAYLERAPNAPDAAQVKAQLAEIEGFR